MCSLKIDPLLFYGPSSLRCGPSIIIKQLESLFLDALFACILCVQVVADSFSPLLTAVAPTMFCAQFTVRRALCRKNAWDTFEYFFLSHEVRKVWRVVCM